MVATLTTDSPQVRTKTVRYRVQETEWDDCEFARMGVAMEKDGFRKVGTWARAVVMHYADRRRKRLKEPPDPGGRDRCERITLSEHEYDAIEELAKSAELSVSEWCRRAVLDRTFQVA